MSDNLHRLVVDVQTGKSRQVPLTESEIADAQRRTAEEEKEKAAAKAKADKHAAMMAWLEQQYDSRKPG